MADTTEDDGRNVVDGPAQAPAAPFAFDRQLVLDQLGGG